MPALTRYANDYGGLASPAQTSGTKVLQLLSMFMDQQRQKESAAARKDEFDRALKLRTDELGGKSNRETENIRLQAIVDEVNRTGAIPANVAKGVDPGTLSAITDALPLVRQQLAPKFDSLLKAQDIENQAKRMEAVAAGIAGNEKEDARSTSFLGFPNPLTWLLGRTDPKAADPQAISKDLLAKAAKLRADNAELLKMAAADPVAPLHTDPKTGRAISKTPDWHLDARGRLVKSPPPAGGAALPQGRSGGLFDLATWFPEAAAVPWAEMPVPAPSTAPNIAAPPAPVTNQAIRVKLSDGRILTTTADKMPAVLARDPKAVVIQTGFASGGTVRGVGGSTADNVTIKASPGEFILPAESMEVPGAPQMAENLRRLGLHIRASRTPRFADGGMVSGMGGGSSGGFDWMSLIMSLIRNRNGGQGGQPKPDLLYNFGGYPQQGF